MTASAQAVRRLDRAAVQRFLPLLDEWLLDGAPYGVQHTWPLLYRSDGDGAFFGILDEGQLLSHCAYRTATLCDGEEQRRVALIGSVATAPAARGRGLAGEVLRAALASLEPDVTEALLWAERPDLYARHGFRETAPDTRLVLARRPWHDGPTVRPASVRDYEALHELHAQKPLRIDRSLRSTSTLLTTPGMKTIVLERGGAPVAYACTGKGADLQGHWHELGGADEDIAALLPAAMHLTGQVEAALLLPPYRAALGRMLARHVVSEGAVPGPMRSSQTPTYGARWIDGLDSV